MYGPGATAARMRSAFDTVPSSGVPPQGAVYTLVSAGPSGGPNSGQIFGEMGPYGIPTFPTFTTWGEMSLMSDLSLARLQSDSARFVLTQAVSTHLPWLAPIYTVGTVYTPLLGTAPMVPCVPV